MLGAANKRRKIEGCINLDSDGNKCDTQRSSSSTTPMTRENAGNEYVLIITESQQCTEDDGRLDRWMALRFCSSDGLNTTFKFLKLNKTKE